MSEAKKLVKDHMSVLMSNKKKKASSNVIGKLESSLINVVHFSRSRLDIQDPVQLVAEFRSTGSAVNFADCIRDFDEMYQLYEAVMDEDCRIVALERKLAMNALKFRVATTVAVGITILFLYWLGSSLGIPLPLLGRSLGGPV